MALQKVLNFPSKQAIARRMTVDGLEYALRDCQDCIRQDIDPEYYRDEISVYRQELAKRHARSRGKG